jgi:hypothetical protein
MRHTRESLVAALDKPLPATHDDIGDMDCFDPWEDVIKGIHGSYAGECDELMIGALKAVKSKTTFEFIKMHGFAAEFMLYVLSGHGLTDYGTSPRGAWPDHSIEDLWDRLIVKWEAWSALLWKES